MPLSAPACADSRSRWALHVYPPATTKYFAWNSTGESGWSRSMATACVMRRVRASSASVRTNVRVTRRMRFALRSGVHVKSGEYFAPIGHTGAQVSLRQHWARPRYGTEFLADGWLHMAMPAFDAQSLSSVRL